MANRSSTDGPDAAWTDDYAWTRHKGPDPYPVPADWVLSPPDVTLTAWYRYPGLGEGLASLSDVQDALDGDSEATEAERAEEAWLEASPAEQEWAADTATEWEFEIDGVQVFHIVGANPDDVMAAVAEALSKFSNGGDWEAVDPRGGVDLGD